MYCGLESKISKIELINIDLKNKYLKTHPYLQHYKYGSKNN